jgi:hypothetical protein
MSVPALANSARDELERLLGELEARMSRGTPTPGEPDFLRRVVVAIDRYLATDDVTAEERQHLPAVRRQVVRQLAEPTIQLQGAVESAVFRPTRKERNELKRRRRRLRQQGRRVGFL